VKKKGEDLKGLYSAEPEENHGRIWNNIAFDFRWKIFLGMSLKLWYQYPDYVIEWINGRIGMNWKEFGRKRSWPKRGNCLERLNNIKATFAKSVGVLDEKGVTGVWSCYEHASSCTRSETRVVAWCRLGTQVEERQSQVDVPCIGERKIALHSF
jgi:hypothetical protein